MKFANGSWVLLLAAATAVVACSEESPSELRRRGDDDPSSSSGGAGGDGGIAPSGGSVRAPYQVKTSAQIANALRTCFGSGVTSVDASMIQTVDNPAGFLSSRQFSAGVDVVTGEAPIIDGDPSVERTGVRNSTLSLSILAALQDIGNVVGVNCKTQSSNVLCKCETLEDAHAMLGRCLPSVPPVRYEPLESGFVDACKKDRATAIASLLASTAFGVQ